MHADIVWPEIWQATGATLYMVGVGTLLSTLIGLPIGILLVLFSPNHLLANRPVYQALSLIVNVLRSVPFIILMIALIPFTEWVMGTSIGTTAAIVPLVVGAAPFYARLAETALREVDPGVIEAAQAMGASTWQIVWWVLLPEARAGVLSGIVITAVALVSYSAMAGVIGGGGLGDLAVRYGYDRFQTDVMLVTIVVMMVLVQVMQGIGDWWVARLSRRGG
ncbi:methionine ABC transporter permease [Alicyclobacillus macrosporangiidus]|uniref:D-methionine transport system permease protein n=1 Tax=Alicyclobacillus macrosporangiidus TaxID=392015 RepID=A0A1I7JDN3_9BACL|nr:methionine ABC transporter permease [Alicyclobacillus macrosporangiidus]SFU83274.1 D-methionine transport system permease protein [Alicyclobacillus macrosporangiidus]